MNNRAGPSAPERTSGKGGRPRRGAGGRADRRERSDGLLTTGDMARLTDNTLRTVRFYEEAGILQPDRRSAGGHRLFSRRQLERLRFITDMRAAGLSLDEIRSLLSLKVHASNGPEAAQAVRAAIDGQLAMLERKLAIFGRLRRELGRTQELLENCEACDNDRDFPDSCRECAIIESEDGGTLSLRVLWALDAPPRS